MKINFIQKTKQIPPSPFGSYVTKEENNEKFLLRAIREGEEEIQIKVVRCYKNLIQDKKRRSKSNKLEYDSFIIEAVKADNGIKSCFYHKFFNATQKKKF